MAQLARSARLRRFSQQLKPHPEGDPYYLHSPGGEEEPAPGWYLRLEGAPVYIGAAAGDAEHWLREQLAKQRPKRRSRAK